MRRRVLAFILCIAAIASIALIPADCAALMIPDESMSYAWYTRTSGQTIGVVRSLATGKEATFDYDVPDDGATIIVFFVGSGNSSASNQFFDELTESKFAKSKNINIQAIECGGCSAETTSAFLAAHDKNNVVNDVYYLPETTMLPYWYMTLVENKGDMSNISTITGSFSAIYLLIVTKEDGVKHIRYEIKGTRSAKYLQNYLNEFTDTGVATIPLIDLNVVGDLHFEFVQPVIDRVNSERTQAGLYTLTSSTELTKLAMVRAIETTVYWSHTRPNGETCFTVTLNGVGYSGSIIAENIAAGQSTPEKVMDSWMNSPGHRANILSDKFNQIGVGCFVTADVFYWVQLFGKGQDNSQLKSSLNPNEVPFRSTLAGVEFPVSAYQDLVGFFMIGEEIALVPEQVTAGDAIPIPYFYARNTVANTLLAAFVPYITSSDADGKGFVSTSTGSYDTELGVKVVPDQSMYAARPAEGTVSLVPYKGSRQKYDLPITVSIGQEGLKGDINMDGKVNAKDVTTLMKVIVGVRVKSYNEDAADINNDGKRNAKDVNLLMKLLLVPVS